MKTPLQRPLTSVERRFSQWGSRRIMACVDEFKDMVLSPVEAWSTFKVMGSALCQGLDAVGWVLADDLRATIS